MPAFHDKRLPRARVAVALAAVLALLVGCSSSVSEDPGTARSDSVLDGMSEDASSAERINAALDAGEIDEPTASLYHVWAQFGDPSLPEKFQGAPAPHDLGVLAEVGGSLDDLPGDIRAKVAPFFERPSNPDSAFSVAEGESTGTTSRGRAATAAGGAQKCSSDWVSEAVPDLPLRVWTCPDVGDDRATEILDITSQVLSDVAPEMFADLPDGLGPPIPDDPSTQDHPDADDRIDVYALPNGWMAPYREGTERVLTLGNAATMSASPKTSTTSSAYVVFESDAVQSPDDLAATLVHELFHAQQYGHFAHLAGLGDGSAWAYDATAVWATMKWVTRAADEQDRVTYRPTALQNSPLSIHDPDWLHGYAANLWALFIEQELGPEAIFQMWATMDSVPAGAPGGAAIAALGEQLDIADVFPEFAMRLFNTDLPGDPVETGFGDILPGFQIGNMPDMEPATLRDDPLTLDHAGIPGLGYRYNHVATDASQQDPVQVTMSTDVATPSGATASIEALVPGPDGDYTREVISSGGSEFCVADDVYLVAANTSLVIDDETTGSVEVTRGGDAGCATTPDPTTTSTTAPAASCDETAGWDATGKAAEFRLNAPIVSVTGDTDDCADTIRIGLDANAGEPGYRVEYVADVTQPGSGNAVPVAGSHALQVVIDSDTVDRTTPEFTPTVATSDNMVDVTGFGAVRQVAHAGSFEGMTTFGIGVEGKQPFTVEAGDNALIIRVARPN